MSYIVTPSQTGHAIFFWWPDLRTTTLAWAKKTLLACPCLSDCLSVYLSRFFRRQAPCITGGHCCTTTETIFIVDRIGIVIPIVTFIHWPCLRRVGHFCFYRLRLGDPGLRRTGTAPRGFAIHGARPLPGDCNPWGHTQVMFPTPSPNCDFLFNFWGFTTHPFPRMLASLGPGLLRFLFVKLCPPGYLSCLPI
jgi:hypothetical protein